MYFPDLPGCASYGATLTEAQRNAQDALALHLYGMERDGEPIPTPSATPEVDPETAAGYLVFPVTASSSLIRDELDNQRVGINMDINETTLKSIFCSDEKDCFPGCTVKCPHKDKRPGE